MRKRLAWILLFLSCLLPQVALADTPAATYSIVGVTTATVIKVGPGTFFGVTSPATQTTVTTCYDNTAASGPIIFQNTVTAASPFNAPASGIAFNTGLTCVIATSIVAPGYIVLWK